jgi:hypothetical protein
LHFPVAGQLQAASSVTGMSTTSFTAFFMNMAAPLLTLKAMSVTARISVSAGTISFDLPPGVNPDDYDSVVIWCKQFNVEIGRAYFSKKMM